MVIAPPTSAFKGDGKKKNLLPKRVIAFAINQEDKQRNYTKDKAKKISSYNLNAGNIDCPLLLLSY